MTSTVLADSLTPREEREDGFTLVEILVVIIIIGILAAIAVPIYLNQQREANAAALRHDMRSMAASMYTFYVSNDPTENYDTPGNAGWAVIARENPDVVFSSDPVGGLRQTVYPEGMDPIPLSDGVVMGVAESVTERRPGGEFCIVGNAENSRYEVKDKSAHASERLGNSLFYDSSRGGILESDQLTLDSACGYYLSRMQNG